jgi:Tat protein secretion system quality control protein TatD with DNase activity
VKNLLISCPRPPLIHTVRASSFTLNYFIKYTSHSFTLIHCRTLQSTFIHSLLLSSNLFYLSHSLFFILIHPSSPFFTLLHPYSLPFTLIYSILIQLISIHFHSLSYKIIHSFPLSSRHILFHSFSSTPIHSRSL